jgi:hypothetical protein
MGRICRSMGLGRIGVLVCDSLGGVPWALLDDRVFVEDTGSESSNLAVARAALATQNKNNMALFFLLTKK